ncbi:MAG: peptidase [Kiritimatiellia bacterium]|jgi:tripeptide aminopeptidase
MPEKDQTVPPTEMGPPEPVGRDKINATMGKLREAVIANLVMLGEIPAPTYGEWRRCNEFMHRLIEAGVQNCAVDDAGNGVGMIAGSEGERSILLAACADSVVDPDLDHSISVQSNRIEGTGISDSLGISVLASLPLLFEQMGIRFRDHIILLGASRSAGRGNLEGIRYFLKNNRWPLRFGLAMKGSPLGRLSYTSIGMLRGEITCTVPAEYDWSRFGASGAVLTINQIISKIAAIPLPRRPVTSIVLGSIEGGTTYDRIARRVLLKFEIRSEEAGMVQKVSEEISDIVAETEAQTGSSVSLDIFARREPGGILISHPVVRACRSTLESLEIDPRIMPSTSETSALIDAGIPAVTLGLSRSRSISDEREEIDIPSLMTGITQLIDVLQKLDGGWAS